MRVTRLPPLLLLLTALAISAWLLSARAPWGGRSLAKSVSSARQPTGTVIYSQLVDTDEVRGEGRPEPVLLPSNTSSAPRYRWKGFDLFLQHVPGGRPVRLTDHRRSHELGAIIEKIKFDGSGTRIAFLANRKGGVGKATGDTSFRRLWLLSLPKRPPCPVVLPGTVQDYSWSSKNPLLVVTVKARQGGRLFLVNARTRSAKPLFAADARRIGPWAWSSTGSSLLYEDALAHALLLRSVHSGRVQARWREPAGLNVVALSPSPDGRQVVVEATDAFYTVTRNGHFRKAFADVGTVAGDSPLWSPDGRLLFLHTFAYFPAEDASSNLPTGTDHFVQVWDTRFRRWDAPLSPLSSWTDGVVPPWKYNLLANSQGDRWLLLTYYKGPREDNPPELLALKARTKARVLLWKAQSPVLSLDWHSR